MHAQCAHTGGTSRRMNGQTLQISARRRLTSLREWLKTTEEFFSSSSNTRQLARRLAPLLHCCSKRRRASSARKPEGLQATLDGQQENGLTWQNSWQKCREASSGDCELSINAAVRPWNLSRSSSIAFRVSYSFSVSPSAIFTTITTAYAQMLRCQTSTRTRTQGGGESTH